MDSTDTTINAKRAKRKVNYAFTRRRDKYVKHPAIRIVGQYLEQYGFKTGDEIEVLCEYGRIVICKVVPDASAKEPTKAR